jgi:hypothetical protein
MWKARIKLRKPTFLFYHVELALSSLQTQAFLGVFLFPQICYRLTFPVFPPLILHPALFEKQKSTAYRFSTMYPQPLPRQPMLEWQGSESPGH